MKPPLLALLAILSFFPTLVLHAQTITTIAGTPTVFGFSGAGGPAPSIEIRSPFNVAVDNGGNIFFTDTYNNCIWKVNTAGIATIYAGAGVYGNTGDGGPATAAELYGTYWLSIDNAGNLYVMDLYGGIRKIAPSGIISTVITPIVSNVFSNSCLNSVAIKADVSLRSLVTCVLLTNSCGNPNTCRSIARSISSENLS